MTDYQFNKVKHFLQDKIEALNNNKFDHLYNELEDIDSSASDLTSDKMLKPAFTELLFKIGVNPLNYINYIPEYFATGLNWDTFYIPSNIKAIGNYAFSLCKSLLSIRIEESVEEIGTGAFEKCIKLTRVVIPDSVKHMDSWVFRGCNDLKEVFLSKNLEEFDIDIFYECPNLENVYIQIPLEKLNMIFTNPFNIKTDFVVHCLEGIAKYEGITWKLINN